MRELGECDVSPAEHQSRISLGFIVKMEDKLKKSDTEREREGTAKRIASCIMCILKLFRKKKKETKKKENPSGPGFGGQA